MDLQGRSAIVTGGAGGLGGATVRHLVAAGMGVVVFDRAADAANALATELGASAVGADGDVNDDAAVQGAIEAAQRLGTLWSSAWPAGASAAGARSAVTARRTTSRPSSARWR